MFSSFRFADQWSNGLVKRFGFQESETWMKNIAEDFGRYQLDPMFTEGLDIGVKFNMASVPKIGDLSSSISMEIQNAISDATYSAAVGILEEMKDAVREGMSEADVKAVMDSDVAFILCKGRVGNLESKVEGQRLTINSRCFPLPCMI